MFDEQLPWYVLGPSLGLILVGLLALANVRMGVLGGFSDLVERASGRATTLGWKGWFVVGVIGGGLLFRLLAGASTAGGDGFVERATGDATSLGAVALLVAGGLLIGYGAKAAGGCTSGNGLSGASFGTRASLVAMGTFMATAIAATAVLEALL